MKHKSVQHFIALHCIGVYCWILAVVARDARAPQGHNWSYNQLKAALLLRLLPSSFPGHLPAARIVNMQISTAAPPFFFNLGPCVEHLDRCSWNISTVLGQLTKLWTFWIILGALQL